jgi:hypothetical protein
MKMKKIVIFDFGKKPKMEWKEITTPDIIN